MARGKPVGWQKESMRHSLASRGIKTNPPKGPKQPAMSFRTSQLRNRKNFKKVDEIAEAFAEGNTDAKARADRSFPDGRVFIEGDTIYSFGYHFPIAMRTGERMAVFNTDKFSNTTSKQQREIRSALESKGFEIREVNTQELKRMLREKGIF